MKSGIIKVIKRNAVGDVDQEISAERRPPKSTVTSTVTEWIAQSRSNRLDQDLASRMTIAGWADEAPNSTTLNQTYEHGKLGKNGKPIIGFPILSSRSSDQRSAMDNTGRLRVLYVEDNCDSLEMVKVLLSMSQIDVEVAQSVSTALSRAKSEKFDLYLLDSGLPDGNGLGLCRSLRSVDPQTPVLFYSGHAHPDAISMGMAAGADGYVTKPHSEKLTETIILLVENGRAKSAARRFLPVLAAAA